jgi:hypothetical protein
MLGIPVEGRVYIETRKNNIQESEYNPNGLRPPIQLLARKKTACDENQHTFRSRQEMPTLTQRGQTPDAALCILDIPAHIEKTHVVNRIED